MILTQAVDNSVTLAPPPVLPHGAIVTLRMRGHARTNGLDYFAPALVLSQVDETIEVFVWDSTAGSYYNPAYQVRELSTRDQAGPTRELYEVRSNIGQVLFDPEAYARFVAVLDGLMGVVGGLVSRVAQLEQAAHVGDSTPEPKSAKPSSVSK